MTASLRIEELEGRFQELESQIPDSPEKQALSVLHGLVQEALRLGHRPQEGEGGDAFERIRTLWRSAPAMEGSREAPGLPVGTPAPDFALPDVDNRVVRLSDLLGRPVVLAFYPLDWSPGCSQQLDLYQHELDELERRGAVLLGISVDSIYSHGAWAAVRGLRFPLLADFRPKGAVARSYEVWRESDGFSERALYVVDPQGVIRYAHVSPQLHHIPDVEELFHALDRMGEEVAV